MATYPGLASTRESVSLDEDDLSDVEDEVFIRDGRNGYKFMEDRGVKRPLMAPRRKVPRPEITSRLKNKQARCKAFCAPCCYALLALTVLIGLIALVVVFVSIFPLPIDKLKAWVISKTTESIIISKPLPCTNLKITELWNINFPHLTSESPFRSIDVNNDGYEDVIFGFGIGEDEFGQPEWFCQMFFNRNTPCQGGVIALDGYTSKELWRRWLPHTIYTLFCSVDINGDGINDCIASGKGGVMCALSGKDGMFLWNFHNTIDPRSLVLDHYAGSFVPDQDKDGIPDVVAAHTYQKERRNLGYLILISGKTGMEFARLQTPDNADIYYAPQHLSRFNGDDVILFGTGNPNSPGGLYMMPLHNFLAQKMTAQLLYQDKIKGVLTPAVFVDITGDTYDDIVVAMFNSTLVAINGLSLEQIWNYTIPNSETLSTPTPGYFNDDNITDFLIKYETGAGFPLYYYSQTMTIDGKTGKPIQDKPLIDSVGSQEGGLTLSMEGHGFDMFIYWMADCKDFEGNQQMYKFTSSSTLKQQSRADICKIRYNSTMVTSLWALNQYDEPPGVQLYNSENHTKTEYNNSKIPISEADEFLKSHPDVEFAAPISIDQNANSDYDTNQESFKSVEFNKNSASNFRHKDNGKGLIKEFSRKKEPPEINDELNGHEIKFDYEQANENYPNFKSYPYEPLDVPSDGTQDYEAPIDDDLMLQNSNRDPRSKEEIDEIKKETSFEVTDEPDSDTSVPQKYGIYDYKNIRMARNRLLHDLNTLPNDILKETYFKNRERELRASKFEQRDLRFRESNTEAYKEVRETLEKEKGNLELPLNLWDLESENEIKDKENGFWRGKRSSNNSIKGIPKLTSVGILIKSINIDNATNSIDLVFATYWLPPKTGIEILLEPDFKCIAEKIKKALDLNEESNYNMDKTAMENKFTKECLNERIKNKTKSKEKSNNYESIRNPFYYNKLAQMSLGQMTVYRIKIECICDVQRPGERCAKFLEPESQNWPAYLGHFGYGYFKNRN